MIHTKVKKCSVFAMLFRNPSYTQLGVDKNIAMPFQLLKYGFAKRIKIILSLIRHLN